LLQIVRGYLKVEFVIDLLFFGQELVHLHLHLIELFSSDKEFRLLERGCVWCYTSRSKLMSLVDNFLLGRLHVAHREHV
jgi:hypothetical protein